MIILGIDPGYAIVGWGVVKKERSVISFIDCGALVTHKELAFEKRLVTLHQGMQQLIQTYTPDVVVIETLYFSKNTKTALEVAHARGVIVLSVEEAKLPTVYYGPGTVKQTIAGDGKATKQQVQFMIKKTLKLSTAPSPDDIADALAIALTHAYTSH